MIVLFNKPFNVLSQFTDGEGRATLADWINIPKVYAAGRLDRDSEGLLLLTDDGKLQHKLASADQQVKKHYWVQVEGRPSPQQLSQLRRGVQLKDGPTRPAQVHLLASNPPGIWRRKPPISPRAGKQVVWLDIAISEGRNRQVRRMTAAVGLPTLRLVRHQIGNFQLGKLQPGEHRVA